MFVEGLALHYSINIAHSLRVKPSKGFKQYPKMTVS